MHGLFELNLLGSHSRFNSNKLGSHKGLFWFYQNNPFITCTIVQSSIQHSTLNQLNITKQIFLNIYHFPSTLILSKYQDPLYRMYYFWILLNLQLSCLGSEFQQYSMDCEFQIPFPIQARSVSQLQVCSYCLNIRQNRLNVALTKALTKH